MLCVDIVEGYLAKTDVSVQLNIDDALDNLLKTTEVASVQKTEPRQRQAEWTPGVTWMGDEGTITTPPVEGESHPDWSGVLRMWGLDPEHFAVVEPVLFNVWGDTLGILNRQWKGKVVRKGRQETADIESLIAEIKKHKPRERKEIEGGASLVVCASDWQVGKRDGDGLKGLVGRWLQAIDDVEFRLKELKKLGRPIDSITVLCLGDLVEGCDGHYDIQTFTVEVDRRDQVKIARRLLRDALIRWSKVVPSITVAAIGGNHGENRKNGKSFTTLGDNDDVALVESVAEIFQANPEAYGHIKFAIPTDELSLTLEVHGQIIGITHGHLARSGQGVEGKLRRWIADQTLGRQKIGDCDILVTGHYHSFKLADWGGVKWLQAPALDGGSVWWRQSTGEIADVGVLTFLVSSQGVSDIQLL
ncbi:metallo-dependent phosphatase-like domain containing protein [Freshwater phage uvFW-CGR-AMD-COM-C203]|nr:metallo-dependent phosphatase-like domain containing protein [Freshwater phage uvFW-CGR-AMD-COM-C203]